MPSTENAVTLSLLGNASRTFAKTESAQLPDQQAERRGSRPPVGSGHWELRGPLCHPRAHRQAGWPAHGGLESPHCSDQRRGGGESAYDFHGAVFCIRTLPRHSPQDPRRPFPCVRAQRRVF